MKHRKLLAGPYLFWAVSFVIIPLLMIVYYGLTDKEGHFQIVHKKRVMSRKESAPDENCNCNKETEYKNCRGEACTGTERGCGPASAKPCDGKKH